TQIWNDNAPGNLTFGGAIALSNNAVLSVVQGMVNSIYLNGGISGAGSMFFNGGGTFIVSGATANTYLGTTTLSNGLLQLHKNANTAAVPGDFVVGDTVGIDIARFQNNGQLATTSNVTINSAGVLDLNGFSQTINRLTMTAGTVSSGAGTLTLGGDVFSN